VTSLSANSLADLDDLDGVTLKVNGGDIGIKDRRFRLVSVKIALGFP